MPDTNLTLDELIAKIKDKDDKVRAAACLRAGKVGAVAIKPLAAVLTSGDVGMEAARAAKRALWRIVRYVGRTDGEKDRRAAIPELLALLADAWPDALRREILWMLSEIADNSCVAPIGALLTNAELQEDARCALQRISGEGSVTALKEALGKVADDFKPAVAQSLRARGIEVDPKKYPIQKLIPAKQTGIKPGGQEIKVAK
jgi:HEAT repeat protein